MSHALRRSLDFIVRNVLAISSIGAYGLAAWRAAFPFFRFGGSAVVMGHELSFYTVLAAVAIIYVVFVVVFLLGGERACTEERKSLITETDRLLERVMALGDPVLSKPILDEERTKLRGEVNQILIDLYEDDALLRFLAFWRWAPDRAFDRQGNYWVLHEPVSGSDNLRFAQPLGVLERPWFQHLIGPRKRVRRQPFGESTASAYLDRIPNWNYRDAIFNELVMILEGLESDDPKVACDRAKVAEARIAGEKPQPGRSVVTLAFIAAYTIMGPVVLSVFRTEIEMFLRSVFRFVKGA